MDSITIRLQEDRLERIANEAEQRDMSRSDVIREWFDERDQLRAECDRLQDECEELQTECDRLQREKRQILDQREEHTDLVRVIEREQSLAERKAEAGLWTKTKWALFGMSDENDRE